MRSNTLFWGVVLILAGSLFLLSNLEILNVNVGAILWPLVIILIGIWMMVGIFMHRSVATEHVAVPMEAARQANLRLQHGGGRLKLAAGTGPGDFLEGDFGGGVEVNVKQHGDVLDATLSPKKQWVQPFFWGTRSSLDWSVNLTRDVPLNLEIKTGANDARVDLSDLLVSELSLNSGASSTDITLPNHAGSTRARISTGVASVRVRIPEGVAARIRARGGLSSISINRTRFPRRGDVYESADYSTAANLLNLDIETGIGSVYVD